jgi:UDP-N-acetylmuramate dehydrogenase
LTALPEARGKLLLNEPLGPFTWFRVGGNADALFIPADAGDLADFLKALDPAVPVTVLGVGSNVIVRDGGVEGWSSGWPGGPSRASRPRAT